jgi:uroporphyrinogen-III synthase
MSEREQLAKTDAPMRAVSSSSETSPLHGKHILVTRTREQASVLCERLVSLGAVPVEFPTIRIVPPQDWKELDAALRHLYEIDPDGRAYYDWLVFTSANGVQICFERLKGLGYNPAGIRNVRFATIGPATAAALARYGVSVALIPGEYVAEGVATALIEDAGKRDNPLHGQRILLARAAEARKVLVTQLQEVGAIVDEVVAYHTISVARDDERGREVLRLLLQFVTLSAGFKIVSKLALFRPSALLCNKNNSRLLLSAQLPLRQLVSLVCLCILKQKSSL